MNSALKATELLSILQNQPPPSSSSSDKNSTTATLIADTKCQLGECVLYHHLRQEVLWTDIYNHRLYKLTLNHQDANAITLDYFEVPKMLCAFALLSSTNKDETVNEGTYLCAFQDGFELYNVQEPSSSSNVANQKSCGENVAPLGLPTRLNDGRCDNEGRRFICGGYFGELDNVSMKIFKCSQRNDNNNNTNDKQLIHEPLIGLDHDPLGNAPNTVRVTNSLSFSPDGHTMYLADSATSCIFRYNYDKQTGNVSQKSLLIQYPQSMGFPDGSCVDKDGYIWNAVWRMGKGPGYVNRIDPNTGQIVYVVHVPDTTSQITCCCFGGEDLDVLFISTASVDRTKEEEPNAGGLYAVKVPFVGREESMFQI